MATTINSDKSETIVGTGTKIFTSTRTTYSADANGKIDPKSVKHELIYYDAPLSPGVVAATSTETSSDWTFANKPLSNNPYLGADAQKSLKEGALKNTTQQQIKTAATKGKVSEEQQKALSTKQVNTATTGNIDDIQSSTSKDLANERGGTRNNFSLILKYPENLQAEFQDVIKFNMVKYSPKNFASSESSGFGFSSRIQAGFKDEEGNTRNIIGTVTLPIPGGISDGNLVDWGSQSMNALQIEAAKIALETINGGGKEGADAAVDSLDKFKKNIGDARLGLSNYFAESAVGNTGQLLARTQGAVTNPNMELLFNGPQLRPFNFTFRLSPRSKKEAESVRGIIRFFKQGMSPIRTQSNLFLKAPHTFQIQYLHIGKEHKFINKIKECALLSFVVNYTPEGNYATFTDGAMVSYEIQMQFTELEPIFNDDYGLGTGSGGPDTEIGY
jgi:hypothetical protein